jgi:hypothetical protein
MNTIKEIVGNITKQAWIISGTVVLIGIAVWLIVGPFSLFKKENAVENLDPKTEEFVNEASKQIFTKDNIERGEYKNDVQSATFYVNNTQEVQVAVVADKKTQEVIENTKEVSCGNLAFVTVRVAGPAVLTNSIKALFENKVDADFVPGNIIPTYHPELTFSKVIIEGEVAKVYLDGNFNGERDGWCDASLAIAQITETAKTFPNITSVEVYQGDKKIY